jgi:hypothetical protein
MFPSPSSTGTFARMPDAVPPTGAQPYNCPHPGRIVDGYLYPPPPKTGGDQVLEVLHPPAYLDHRDGVPKTQDHTVGQSPTRQGINQDQLLLGSSTHIQGTQVYHQEIINQSKTQRYCQEMTYLRRIMIHHHWATDHLVDTHSLQGGIHMIHSTTSHQKTQTKDSHAESETRCVAVQGDH